MDKHPLEFWLECHNLNRKWLCKKLEASRSQVSKVFNGKQVFSPVAIGLIEEMTFCTVTASAMNRFYLNSRI